MGGFMEFSHALKSLMAITGIKLTTLSKEVGFDTSYLSRYANGKMIPKLNQMQVLSTNLATCFGSILANEYELLNDVNELLNLKLTQDNVTHQLKEFFMNSIKKDIQSQALSREVQNSINEKHVYYLDDFVQLILNKCQQVPQNENKRCICYGPTEVVMPIIQALKDMPITLYNPLAKPWLEFINYPNIKMVKNDGVSYYFVWLNQQFLINFSYYEKTKKIVAYEINLAQAVTEFEKVITYQKVPLAIVQNFDLPMILSVLYTTMSEPSILVNCYQSFKDEMNQPLIKSRIENNQVKIIEHDQSFIQNINYFVNCDIKLAIQNFDIDYLFINAKQGYYGKGNHFFQIEPALVKDLFNQLNQVAILDENQLKDLIYYHLNSQV